MTRYWEKESKTQRKGGAEMLTPPALFAVSEVQNMGPHQNLWEVTPSHSSSFLRTWWNNFCA
eukprot:3530905-Amphidinium_carterae.1